MNSKKLISYFLIIMIMLISVYAQSDSSFTPRLHFPADSLLAREELSVFQRLSITMIKFWQTYSYSEPGLNCQFYPSCSNLCALTIADQGVLPGLVIGADRFLRCHSNADGGYVRHEVHTAYLSDKYIITNDVIKSNKKLRLSNNFSVIT